MIRLSCISSSNYSSLLAHSTITSLFPYFSHSVIHTLSSTPLIIPAHLAFPQSSTQNHQQIYLQRFSKKHLLNLTNFLLTCALNSLSLISLISIADRSFSISKIISFVDFSALRTRSSVSKLSCYFICACCIPNYNSFSSSLIRYFHRFSFEAYSYSILCWPST